MKSRKNEKENNYNNNISLNVNTYQISFKRWWLHEYKAILYSVTKYHILNHKSTKGYDNGWKIKIFGLTIYDEIKTYVSA